MAVSQPLLFCFFVSGVASLIFEVLWVRLLTLTLGHTTYAVSAVLAVFMGGLMAGSYWESSNKFLGQEKTCRRYALIEILIGALGLIGTLSLRFLTTPSSIFVALLLLLIPAFLMGLTFPLLSKLQMPIGTLYGTNTLGAVAGTLLAGFFLIPVLGVTKSAVLAALMNALCAVIAFGVSKRSPSTIESKPDTLARESFLFTNRNAWLLAVLLFSGAGAFVCEVAWTRAFAMVLGSSTYAFSIMLACFLSGVGVGGLVYERWVKGKDLFPWVACHVLFLFIAFSLVSYLSLFNVLPYRYVQMFKFAMDAPWAVHVVQFFLCASVMALPTFLMGCSFPWVADMAAAKGLRVGVGVCYAALTLGNILGIVLGGLVLLPRLGAERTLIVGASFYLTAGLIGLAASKIKMPLKMGGLGASTGAFLLVVAFRSAWDPYILTSGAFIYAPSYSRMQNNHEFISDVHKNRLLFYKDGISSTVAVLDSPLGERFLRINGKTDASSGIDMSTQMLLGYLPAIVHKGTIKDAVVVGFGSGVSAAAIATVPSLESLECVELEPAVIEAGSLFESLNRGVLKDPRFKAHLTDARRFFARSQKKYDVIMSEPSNPWLAGVANLYSEEAFRLAKDRLNPDGVFCQWFHSYAMSDDDFKLVMRTFKAVFPNAMLFTTGDKDFFLLGTASAWSFPLPNLVEKFRTNATMAQDMRALSVGHPFAMMATMFLLESDAYDAYAGAGPLLRDDRPTLEFSAPRHLHRSQDRLIWDRIMEQKTQMLPAGLSDINVSRSEWGALHNMAAESFLRGRNVEMAEAQLQKALEFDPASPRAWANMGRVMVARNKLLQSEQAFEKSIRLDSGYAMAWFHLGMLYAQQGILDKAQKNLENGLRLSPADPMGSLQLAQLYIRLDQTKKAQKVLTQAMGKPILNSDLNNAIMQLHSSLQR